MQNNFNAQNDTVMQCASSSLSIKDGHSHEWYITKTVYMNIRVHTTRAPQKVGLENVTSTAERSGGGVGGGGKVSFSPSIQLADLKIKIIRF